MHIRTQTVLFKMRLLLAGILALQFSFASAQDRARKDRGQQSYPVVSEETYYQVLDIVFPRADPDKSKSVFQLVLRFQPSFHSTSQIVLRRRVDGAEVVEYTSPDGNIYDKLNDILAHGGKEDAVAMAKSIKVRRREVNLPYARVKRWYSTFFQTLARSTRTLSRRGSEFDRTRGRETFILDGTVYKIFYENRLNEISLTLFDVEVDTPGSNGEVKLVQWMNEVRRTVAKSK